MKIHMMTEQQKWILTDRWTNKQGGVCQRVFKVENIRYLKNLPFAKNVICQKFLFTTISKFHRLSFIATQPSKLKEPKKHIIAEDHLSSYFSPLSKSQGLLFKPDALSYVCDAPRKCSTLY